MYTSTPLFTAALLALAAVSSAQPAAQTTAAPTLRPRSDIGLAARADSSSCAEGEGITVGRQTVCGGATVSNGNGGTVSVNDETISGGMTTTHINGGDFESHSPGAPSLADSARSSLSAACGTRGVRIVNDMGSCNDGSMPSATASATSSGAGAGASSAPGATVVNSSAGVTSSASGSASPASTAASSGNAAPTAGAFAGAGVGAAAAAAAAALLL